MTTPRRRLIRPPRSSHSHPAAQLQKLHAKLAKERLDLSRWMTRLKRAFHAVEKHQQRISRLEKQIHVLQGA